MELAIYGSLRDQGLEVIKRNDRYFLRYDAGAHMSAWREDEISESEFESISLGGESEKMTILEIQRRIKQSGFDPNQQNWSPA
jgi:hypothetical protein